MSTQEIPSQADFGERAKTNHVPIARLIGFEVKDIADGRATVVLAAGPQHANPMGTLHGGVLCDIADAAMGIAFASTLAQEESGMLPGGLSNKTLGKLNPLCKRGRFAPPGLRVCRLVQLSILRPESRRERTNPY